MQRRSPVPTPRRSCRTRQPPQRYEEYVTELPAVEALPQRGARRSDSTSEVSATTTASRQSAVSVRAAALRVELLQKEHELQRRSEEASRALELHRACSELEMAALEEEESTEGERAQGHRRNPSQLQTQAEIETQQDCAKIVNEDAAPEYQIIGQAAKTAPVVAATAPATTTAPVNVTINQPPKMDILVFDGQAERYPFFKMQVHEVKGSGHFTELQITQHLRERLRGKAFEAVHGILLSGGSLDRILQALESRFGNRFVVTRAVTEKLLNRQKVRSGDIEDLGNFCSEIYNALSILEAVEYRTELDNYRTLASLVEKLPPESQLGWGSFARAQAETGRPLTCQLLYDYVNNHLKDRQFGMPNARGLDKASKRPDSTRQRSYATADTVTVDRHKKREQTSIRTTGSTLFCFYCNDPHWIARCNSFRELSVDERWKWANDNGSCVSCLSTHHQAAQCHRTKPCGSGGCQEKHHQLLHRPASGKTKVVGAVTDRDKYAMMMKTVIIDITGPSKTRRCVAYLDEGSSVTLISQDLADELGCRGRPHDLKMKTMSGTSEQKATLVDVTVGNLTTGEKHWLRDVVALPALALDKNPVPMKTLEKKFQMLKKLNVPHLERDPEILIGLDNADLIATRQIVKTTKNGPLLQKTELGWTVTGRVVVTTETEYQAIQFIGKDGPNSELDNFMQATWATESFGCKFQEDTAYSPEDRKAEKMLDREVIHDGSRWIAPLLRRERDDPLPESRRMAERRARSFESKLDRSEKTEIEGQPSFAEMCYARMDKMITDGHVRKLTKEEAAVEPQNTWYLPLLAVSNASKPGKVRLVLDAAARSHGKCLNDFLMSGPDYFNSIPGIVIRWREKPIGITSDVVAMFSQVLIKPSDRASLRFLWRGRRRTGPFDVYESSVVIFGSKASPSTAGYCYRRTAEQFGNNPEVRTAVFEDTYVDDVISGAETSEKAGLLIKDLMITLRRGGFELGPWASNSTQVLSALPLDLRAEGDVDLRDGNPGQRALGLIWSPSADELTYKARTVPAPGPATKRTILSLAMSVFDPIGLLSGWLLTVRLLLQHLWKQELSWDSPVPDDCEREYRKWTQELGKLESVRIPRHMFDHEAGIEEAEMHVFCDASQKAFCAVAYYLWTQSGRARVSFVAARSRLAPTKPLTIPRLELQAAVLATRLAETVKKENRLNITRVTFWSDSKNVLSWIQAEDRRYHVFVANRITEIRETTTPDQWRYVPSGLNPADGGSRGHTLDDLKGDGSWICGPEFLRASEDEWPVVGDFRTSDVLKNDPETKLVCVTSTDASPDIREAMPGAARFSRWSVAVRTVAVILRWRRKIKRRPEFRDADEFSEAETLWMKLVQREKYASELEDLENGRQLSSTSSLAGLSPVLKDGLICFDTRTKRSPNLSDTARYPPFLARDHPYTQLFIQHLHEKMGHRAHDAVLVELRQSCWVPQAAREIRKIVARCQTCRNRKAQPCQPRMAPLPKSRVTMLGGAFQATGMDYFGPLYVTRGRTVVKQWGVIFRCFATRAVHLELADSLDTDSALLAIARFQARRGNVKEMWSDNATNFRGAARELKAALQTLDQAKMKSKLSVDGIKWSFNPPGDPEAGGVWERQIRTAKETLRAILHEQRPRQEVLSTLLCEVEKIMNSTPLFHVPVTPYDEDVLTPYHFLIGRATPSYPVGAFTGEICLRKRWKQVQQLADHFWRRWVREYLPTLAKRTKWAEKEKNVKEGDVVIVMDQQHPRGLWPKGIVEETYTGDDGVVRSVVVRTAHGKLHRSVRKLIVLDVISNNSREAGV